MAGLLSSWGEGGIGVIEASGPNAGAVLNRLFLSPRGRRLNDAPPGRLLYGILRRGEERLDEVVIECVARSPRPRYLINCHGGVVAVRRVLDALAGEGVRIATADELLAEREADGEMDTVQREAAERLPRASTLRAVRTLLAPFRGELSTVVAGLRDRLAASDDPAAAAALRALRATARFGCGLLDPARLVIAGRPNVGKSSLVNALLRYERMIVHPVPGTTRDVVEDDLAIHGVPFRLADTAGLRATGHPVEQEGVARGRLALRDADIAVIVFDGAAPLQPEDCGVLDGPLPPARLAVVNKSDLPQQLDLGDLSTAFAAAPVRVSALTGEGLDRLEEAILRAAYPEIPPPDTGILFTDRQERRLGEALAAVETGDRRAACEALDRFLHEPRRPTG